MKGTPKYFGLRLSWKMTAILSLIIGTLVISSCSGYQKLIKSNDFQKQLDAANNYYDKGDYTRALQLYDNVLPMYRGTDKAAMITFNMGKCYYQQGDYIVAGFKFKTFAKNSPNSALAEEALYLSAFCTFLTSPEYSLDQSDTYSALQEFQLFLNLYPNSERAAKCNDLMDELRSKLEKKDYEIGKLFYNMGDYQSAITCFKNVYKEYPNSHYKEDLLFLTLKAYCSFAENSVQDKKKERYKGALDSYSTFITFYPESKYTKEAKVLQSQAFKAYSVLNINN
ncbi:MAG: outer membrane protein assembly factor BamD [Bacteroidota bacterium]